MAMAPPGSCRTAGCSTASLEGDGGVGWELELVLTPFPRAPPTRVRCCWQHGWVNYLETGVKTFYKYGHGRRDFPDLPPCLSRVSLQCCLQPCSSAKEHLEVCLGAVWVSPVGPEHPQALPWLWVLARRHLTSWAPPQAGSISHPSHCALPDGEGFIQGGRGTSHPPRAALPANTSPLCPWAKPELKISNLKLSENSP